MLATKDLLFLRLDEARRLVELEGQRRDEEATRIAFGRAEGIAETLEMLGINVPIWIGKPNY
jgi:hypothetical protein